MRLILIAAAFLLLLAPRAGLAQDANAQKAWKTRCASCHGEDGKGQATQGKKMGVEDMTTAAWQKEFTDAKIKTAIQDGLKREKNGKKQQMSAYKEKLKPEEIDGLVKVVRGLAK